MQRLCQFSVGADRLGCRGLCGAICLDSPLRLLPWIGACGLDHAV
ncbi:MFS family permease [Pseudomonas syringae pv. actinidiae]|uniref:MFS family permease n=1 Tax=Pseudomonas syringae pv. actinidiae TaxID=103796 RepID=A0A2V0QCL1_PSESF|nr:MFS family permease [Pseudomonas syringae pv. actinidiae]